MRNLGSVSEAQDVLRLSKMTDPARMAARQDVELDQQKTRYGGFFVVWLKIGTPQRPALINEMATSAPSAQSPSK